MWCPNRVEHVKDLLPFGAESSMDSAKRVVSKNEGHQRRFILD